MATEFVKKRHNKEEMLAAFRLGVAKFRTLHVPHTSAGSNHGNDAGGEDALGTKLIDPPSSVFNTARRVVAKYFSVKNDRNQFYLGKVDGTLLVHVTNSDRILVQVWYIVSDDANEKCNGQSYFERWLWLGK